MEIHKLKGAIHGWRELAKEVRDFDQIFAGGRSGEPDAKTLGRMVARQKTHRQARR